MRRQPVVKELTGWLLVRSSGAPSEIWESKLGHLLEIGIFYLHPKILTLDARELDSESTVQKME